MFRLTFILLILSSGLVQAQEMSELEKRNGFKDIKLTMPIDSVKGIKLKKEFIERDEFPAKLYSVENDAYAKIGEVDVNKVELKTYKGMIYEILVVTDKDTRLMKALESIYGRAEYDMKKEIYFWKAPSLVMTFKSHSKNQLEMTYFSYEVSKIMKEDKAKKVEDIADDF